jgi:hypothetical protein
MVPTTSTQLRESWNPDETLRERFLDREPHEDGGRHADRDRSRAGITGALVARLRGPGGYYNIGNAVALTTGLGVQIAAASGGGRDEPRAVLEAVRQYFIGSPGATALTLAIAIFFASGEMYHRAWSRGFPPERRANWWGDFLSGVAAVMLTFALAAFGDVLLAVVSGMLLAAGKFGSALAPEDYDAPSGNPWPNRFRAAVLLSRIPALAALISELVPLLGSDAPPPAGSQVMTAVMLACYLLWARADLLLFTASHARTGCVVPGGAETPK